MIGKVVEGLYTESVYLIRSVSVSDKPSQTIQCHVSNVVFLFCIHLGVQ